MKTDYRSYAKDPSVIADLALAFGRVYDRCPKEVQVIQEFVSKNLKVQKKVKTDAERYALVATAFQELFPKVMDSPQCKKATQKMLKEYAKLPNTAATRLQTGPDDHSIGFAIAFGLGAGGVLVGVICLVIWAAS